MKLNYFFLVILPVLFFGCNSQTNHLNHYYNLEGAIWKLQEDSYYGREVSGEYQIGGSIGKVLMIFNEKGNLIYKTSGISGSGLGKFFYDKDDNLTHIKVYVNYELEVYYMENDGSKSWRMLDMIALGKDFDEYSTNKNYEYEYDDRNNWIKRYKFNEAGEIDVITLREIKYYGEVLNKKDFEEYWYDANEKTSFVFKNEEFYYGLGLLGQPKGYGTWELDTEQNIVTLNDNLQDEIQKYKYHFEGYQLVLSTLQGKEKFRLEDWRYRNR